MTPIDCKSVRAEILGEILAKGYKNLKLVIIATSADPASAVYVKNKIKTAESVGIVVEVIECISADLDTVKVTLNRLAQDPSVTGIILQLPLAENLKPYERELLDLIPYEKDVDGLTSESMGRLWSGKPCIAPATAAGIMRLLPEDLSKKTVTIVGRSNLIGKPLMKLLLDRNASIMVVHSKSSVGQCMRLTNRADIIITGVGKPEHFNEYFFRDFQTIIDCGINRNAEGKLCGDVKVESLEWYKGEITPVPGGVGILTTAQLMYNVTKAYELQEGLSREKK